MSKGRAKYERTDFTDLFNSINGRNQSVDEAGVPLIHKDIPDGDPKRLWKK